MAKCFVLVVMAIAAVVQGAAAAAAAVDGSGNGSGEVVKRENPICTQGLHYCGWHLKQMGGSAHDYLPAIYAALDEYKLPHDDDHVNKGVFKCEGDSNNPSLWMFMYCEDECNYRGYARNDHCKGFGGGPGR
ncbi:hypothetical protein QBC35DRAFT_234729 [Podospora australis]|uniref:Uncharacterized protein n=1 Tax=Podospora australis TaxID=1536484 RepID=A0AAN6WSI4_9PEZI|nr:hypothetical protein QBC35DRAFT_234729 [Podospora australis]